MLVVPTINCKDFKCVRAKFKKAVKFLPKGSWIQIDISDGKFTRAKTWNNPCELNSLQPTIPTPLGRDSDRSVGANNLNIEVHLMVENPEKIASEWLKAGAKRAVVHVEAIKDIKPLLKFKNKIGVAIKLGTPPLKIIPFLKYFRLVLFLAVKPGFSGQKFNPGVLKEIKWIKSKFPKAVVGIDGGINLETARLAKKAGADIIVSGSYIWNSKNPAKIYRELSSVH